MEAHILADLSFQSASLGDTRDGVAIGEAAAHRPDAQFQRRALYEGAWLSLAYTAHGKLDDACAVAELALPRMRQVRSPRSTALMTTLAGELRRRRRNHTVDGFVPRLEAALSQNARQPRPAL